MNLTDVSKNIFLTKKKQKKIQLNMYPKYVIVPSNIVSILKTIEGYTNYDKNKKNIGSIGNEYAVSIIFFLDKLYPTKNIKGDKTQVKFSTSLKITPFYSGKLNEKVMFELNINGNITKTQSYKTKDIVSNLLYGIVGSFHTHPKFNHTENISQYSFFSNQDIFSLVNGSMYFSGLVFNRYIWLACKSDDSNLVPEEILREASRAELTSYDNLKKYVSSVKWSEFGLCLYEGKFGEKLNKIGG